ncbi:hypothetical protein ACROYT_G040750 [Oculina patagonica]
MKQGLFFLLTLVSVIQMRSSIPSDIHLQLNDVKARSCLDYLQHGKFENGFYWLFDDQDKRYVAYCDLSSEPGSAWTIVMSWNLEYKNLPQFRSKSFMQDAPINHNTPNWYIYRQTVARMESLRSRSTYWRATCSFNIMKQKIDYRDYLRGKFSDFDIMSFFGGGQCKPVDYVNIRGHAAGSGTTAKFWQWHSYILHTDSSMPGSCAFKPNAGAISSEDNFGYYNTVNKNFRCTMGDVHSTNWWFGGYMAD